MGRLLKETIKFYMFWEYNQSLRKSAYNERTLHFISKIIHWVFRSWGVSWFKANDTSTHLLSFSSVQSLSRVRLFATPWTAAHKASLSITNSQSLLKLMSIKSVMPYNHLIIVPFSSCLQSFSASGSFLVSQFFASGGQSIGVSAAASVLPMNIQDWFPSQLTGLIFLQSKGL